MTSSSDTILSAYYDNEAKDYWLDVGSGWLNLTEGGLVRHLRAQGCGPTLIKGTHISLIDKEILRIQTTCRVDYAGGLAGWSKGLYSIMGRQVLVTSSPALLLPQEGDWKLFEACLDALLKRPHPMQVIFWKAHHKMFLDCLYNRYFRPGPANFLIGPRDCGKSFLQDRYTDTVGGRFADPWLYISGGTPFNREHFSAEHLKIADPNIYNNHDLGDFSNMIKHLLMDEPQSCHGKFREAVALPPRRRLSVSANLEQISVVPSLDDSMMDKMNLYKCAANSIPPPGFEDIPYHQFVARVQAELPAYVWHLLNEFKVPKEIEGRRCGVITFHNPELVEAIAETLTEVRLLHVMDDYPCFFDDGQTPWRGSISDLEKALEPISSNGDVKQFVNKPRLLTFLLMKLSSGPFKHRVKRDTTRTKNKRAGWIIYPANAKN